MKTRELIKSNLARPTITATFVCFARVLFGREAVFIGLFQELLSSAAKATPKRWLAITLRSINHEADFKLNAEISIFCSPCQLALFGVFRKVKCNSSWHWSLPIDDVTLMEFTQANAQLLMLRHFQEILIERNCLKPEQKAPRQVLLCLETLRDACSVQ